MISVDYLNHLKYKRWMHDGENNLKMAVRARRLADEALASQIVEYAARQHKEKYETIMRSLLTHKSISSHVGMMRTRIKRVADLLRDSEAAVAAERAAVDRLRRCRDEAMACFAGSVSNWDARRAFKNGAVSGGGGGGGADMLERDTVTVKICGQVDTLSNGTIKRYLCDLFQTIAPGSAFETARVVLRSCRDAA